MDRYAWWGAIFVTLAWFLAAVDFSAGDQTEAQSTLKKTTIQVGLR